MSVKTTSRMATLPAVNLIPPEISERKALRHIQAGVAVGVLLAAAGVSFLYMSGRSDVAHAKNDLADATAQQASLERQVQRFSDVHIVAGQLAAANAMLAQANSTKVYWSTYLSDLSSVLPATTWLTSLEVNEGVAPGSISTATQVPAEIGTITMQGYALTWNDVASYLDSIGREPGLANEYVSKGQEQYIGSRKVVTLTSSTDVTSGALCAIKPGGC